MTKTNDDWTAAPYAEWLEEVIRTLVESNPLAIAIEMVTEEGLVATSYYNVSPNDRACIIDAMHDDAREEWLISNKDFIKAILYGDDDIEVEDDDVEPDEPN